jgi:hypothetical protein
MTDICLSVSVMTHPARLGLATELASRLSSAGTRLAVDPRPAGPRSAVRAAAVAWEQLAPRATHHLVLQDDVLPHADLLDAVTRAVRRRSEAGWTFYSNWDSRAASVLRIAAMWGCASFEPPRDEYVSTLGVVLPHAHAVAFAARLRSASSTGAADDALLGQYARDTGLRVWQTIPNLIEHADGESLVGNNFEGRRRSAYYDALARFDQDGPALRIEEVPYFPFLRGNAKADLLYPAGDGTRSVPLSAALATFGLEPSAVLRRYVRDRYAVASRYHDTDIHAAIDAHGEQLWLVGAAYGALTACTGRDVAASDRTKQALWRTLINGTAFQRTPVPAAEVISCLSTLVTMGFAAAVRSRDIATQHTPKLSEEFG